MSTAAVNEPETSGAAATAAANPLKRSLADMQCGQSTSDADATAAADRDALVRERRALEQSCQSGGGGGTAAAAAQPAWTAAAIEFAQQRLHDADSVAHFRRLIAQIREEAAPTAAVPAAVTAVAAALTNGDERKETQSGSVAPTLPTISALPAVSIAAPLLPAVSPAVATPVTPATPATPAAAAASSAASSSSFGPLLATISDVSLLVPRGKYQLQLCSTGATFAVPATPAKSLSFPWSDVDTVFDIADVNKRDWLLVVLLKKGRGVAVGKQIHHAFVVKMLATDKLKETRATVAAPVAASELADAQSRMQSFLNENAFTGATKLSSGMVSLLRLVPALRSVQFVSHEPAIFSSLKQLPCVSCKLGVEDGALYFLRTGLLFIKPVLYIPLADLDGITPARGMSSTFDMKVGIVGQKNDTAFIMIEPKEEQAISKYCAFLATEQTRMEKKEKMDKAAAAAAAAAPPAAYSAIPAAAASSNNSAAAAAASTGSYATNASPISLLDDEDVAEQTIPSSSAAAAAAAGGIALPVLDAVSSANVIAGPRPARKAKPASFVGMEDEDEEAEPQPAASSAAAAGGAEGGGDSDGSASSSDDSEDEWSDASDSDSDESAEYDSAKDEEEINSEDERERERERVRRKTKEDDQSDEEAEMEGADVHETPDETMAD